MHTAELVVSLRDFIRSVLDLDPISPEALIPKQGPARPGAAARSKGGDGERDGGKAGKGGGDLAAGAGAGAGLGMGLGAGLATEDDEHTR